MFDQQKQFLHANIKGVLSHCTHFQWLTDQRIQATKVADFGCQNGIKTLSLMLVLGASEATGVDIDAQDISQAQRTLNHIQEDVRRISRLIDYPDISAADRAWWDKVPEFFKQRLLQPNCVTYLVADMTKRTVLCEDYYDVSHCRYVLYNLSPDQSEQTAKQHAKARIASAVKEMARVTRPGGIVAASEPLQDTDGSELEFTPFFSKKPGYNLCAHQENQHLICLSLITCTRSLRPAGHTLHHRRRPATSPQSRELSLAVHLPTPPQARPPFCPTRSSSFPSPDSTPFPQIVL